MIANQNEKHNKSFIHREFFKLFRARWVGQGKNFARPKFTKRKQRSKGRIPPQTPPSPLATSEFKKESFVQFPLEKGSRKVYNQRALLHNFPEWQGMLSWKYMNQPRFGDIVPKKFLLVFVCLVVVWAVLLHYVPPAKVIEALGVQNGYVLSFIIALLGDLPTFSNVPYNLALLTLASAKSLNPVILGLCAGVGVIIADFISYLIGFHGRNIVPSRYQQLFSRLSSWALDHPNSWLIPLGLFLYGALVPFPNYFIVIPLALGHYPFWRLALPLAVGNILLSINVALLGMYGLASFFS